MCLSRITQRHAATDRQNELAIADVIGKLTHLGWIRLREYARNPHCRILRRRAFREYRGVAKGAALLYLRDQLRCNVTANGIHAAGRDRKSTRVNSSHFGISYAVFCL